jgi:hypothetical protein
VTPVLCDGRLYLFMEPTSPKGHDLRREPRYAMHSLVTDQDGNPGEFHIKGRGQPVDDPAVRARVAEAAPYEPMERWIVFEFSVEEAASTHYEGKEPVRRRWRAACEGREPQRAMEARPPNDMQLDRDKLAGKG